MVDRGWGVIGFVLKVVAGGVLLLTLVFGIALGYMAAAGM